MSGDGEQGMQPGDGLGIPGMADLRRFAVGSSGIVYRAEDVRHGRTVAVKVLNRGRVDTETELALERELAAMGRLSTHPNIIDLYGSGTTVDRHPYIVMPYYERGNYADLVDESGPLPWSDVLDFGVKIAGALHTAHVRGFVHRDVKPANIFRGEFDRQPILADFGIASFAAPGIGGSFTVKVSTTPLYGAPEVLEGERPTERSDIYSFGASLFALLEGAPAFTDPSTEVVVHRVTAAKTPPRPTASIPDGLADLLGHMMARDPARRPATCLAVAERLVEIQKARGIDPTPIVADGVEAGDAGAAVLAEPATGREPPGVVDPPRRPRLEPIGRSIASSVPSSTRPVGSVDRPTEPAEDIPAAPRPGPAAATRVRPAQWWAVLAAAVLLVAAIAYTTLSRSGPNPGELVERSGDDEAAAVLRAAWAEAGEPTLRWVAHPSSWVTDVAFSPAGPEVATAGTDGAVRIWPATGSNRPSGESDFGDWVIDVDWTSDGRRLAVAVTDGATAVAPAEGGASAMIDRSGPSAEAVAWDPTGTRLLTGYAGGRLVLRLLEGIEDPTGPVVVAETVLDGHDGDVLDVDWAPAGDRAVSSAKDGRVIVWDSDVSEPVTVVENPDRRWSRSVQWVAATLFLTTDDDGTVTLRSVTADGTVEELSRIGIGSTVLASDLWLDDSVLLAAAYEDGSIRIWDLVTGDEVADLTPANTGPGDGGEGDDATAITWSRDGRALAVGRLDGSVQLWSLDSM